ncbi:translation initiation factor IF-2 [Allohahella sp. A8]|uniref:translation initiation factor IF-2 n=1 Tax=Allohahella sp. A8 TaxID=3141461 RepID=UPI000C0B2F10|nr:translation initiation factor IF-2 [Hahellaceae bacterium]|tara:strand:+ start:42029 stop:44641 length:2613 start_codon:yes stop_codon:yes gene_type:complete
MAEVTVKQLADDVGASVDKIIQQLAEAGIQGRGASDVITDDEKQTLLRHLKQSHGEAFAEPRKITLKRKTTTKLRSAGSKTVNVEVRKKRTYVKRADITAEAEPEPEVPVEAAAPAEAEVAVTASQAETAETTSAESTAPEATNSVSESSAETAEVAAETSSAEAPAPETAEQATPAAAAKPSEPVTPEEADRAAKEAALAEAEEAKKSKHRRHKEEAGTREDKEDTPPVKKQKPKVAAAKPRRTEVEAEFTTAKTADAPRSLRAKAPRMRRKRRGGSSSVDPNIAKITRDVSIPDSLTVGELAQKMAVKSGEVIKKLMGMGVMANVNQVIEQDVAQMVAEEMGHKVTLTREDALETEMMDSIIYEGEVTTRAPVVSVMGHVDHGKTSLLDYIRRAKVAASESGGITQHIGAYLVQTDKGQISFLDTPGHAAFTAMRARGAKSTDIVILVVAADDGVMPQTKEAVQHAKSADMPIIVAVNKIDKEDADPERVKNELSALDVISEEWGGDVQFVNVSAHTGEGIDNLLDAILLQSELLELTAVKSGPARGVVIESRLDKGRGVVASVLVQNGTLKKGDIVLAGEQYGRVRAMLNEHGKTVDSAEPSTPVEILGLNETPEAGDEFVVVADERKAREVAAFRQEKVRSERLQRQQSTNLENMFQSMGKGETKILNMVVKTDVRGSLEAIISSLTELGNEEVQVNIVGSGVGGISETDANLAVSTNSIVVGFNVRADGTARKILEREGVELRYYSIIYNIIDDVKAALTGMLAPAFREDILGIAEVRDTFKSPKFGQVAGCIVVEGTVYRSKPIRVLRDDVVIFEGELESLRRFKDDVAEVRSGTECGIGVRNYEVKIGDKIEVFDRVQIERTL